MLAGFSIVPLGVGEELKQPVAEVLALVADSGLPYRVGPMQTTVEGEAEAVLDLVLRCHRHARQSAPRVLTSIVLDDREGAAGRLDGKVADVEAVLGRRLRHE